MSLPVELVNLIMEYKFHKHLLPYDNIVHFNACLKELPRCIRMTSANRKYYRYRAFERPVYGYQPQDRFVYIDYMVNNIQIEECSIRHF